MDGGLLDSDHIHEIFSAFGAVQVRRFFGGNGLFADGVIFGMAMGDRIYLKADASTIPSFEKEGCAPFEYTTRNGKREVRTYWRLPDRLYDDPEELAQWARRSLAIAHNGIAARARSPARKKPAGKRKKRR